jgi:hypothetical protein
VTVRSNDDEGRPHAVDLAPERVEWMSFDEPGFNDVQRTHLCPTALAGVLGRLCELTLDARRNPPGVDCEGRVLHGRKDERTVLARHARRDPGSFGARV